MELGVGLTAPGDVTPEEMEMLKRVKSKDKVSILKDRFQKMQTAKQPWHILWSYVSEFVMIRKQNFSSAQTVQGQFVSSDIFSGTAPLSCYKAGASIVGMLWNSGGRTFVLEPSRDTFKEDLRQSKQMKEYCEKLSRIVHKPFTQAKAAYVVSLTEAVHEAVGYGTGGIHAADNFKDDPSVPVKFNAVDVKRSCIDEGPDGWVDTVFTEHTYTIRQLVKKYGFHFVSSKIRKQYLEGKSLEDEVKVHHCLEPRMKDTAASYGNDGFDGSESLPVASIHYEVDTDHILHNSGYEDMPTFVFRFWKHVNETYGRGPGTESIPTILTLNALEESLLVGSEKTIDPPTWSYDDGFMGGGTINKSAGANNALRIPNGKSSGFSGQPMGPIFAVGDMKPTMMQAEKYDLAVEKAFFLDILQSLGKDGRMTLGEAQMHQDIRWQAIITMFVRLQGELTDPLIERVFNILFKHDLCGLPLEHPKTQEALENGASEEDLFIMPDAIWAAIEKGEDVFDIRYLTPAARMMQSEELKGIRLVLEGIQEVAKLNQGILKLFSWERLLRIFADRGGAPEEIIQSIEEIKQMHEAEAEAMQQQNEIAMAQAKASIEKDASQAAKNAAAAGAAPMTKIV